MRAHALGHVGSDNASIGIEIFEGGFLVTFYVPRTNEKMLQLFEKLIPVIVKVANKEPVPEDFRLNLDEGFEPPVVRQFVAKNWDEVNELINEYMPKKPDFKKKK